MNNLMNNLKQQMMTSYNLNDINTTDRQTISPYLTYGSGQVLRINMIELKVSNNTGSPKAILHMETKPIEEPGFTPIDGAKGRVGKIAIGVYMKTDEQKREFLKKLKMIAVALGLENEINEIQGSSFEEVVTNIQTVICGGNKWARYTIFGEQYPKNDGKVGVKLFLPRYNFVESLETDDEASRLVKFDENNGQHFKKIAPGAQPYVGNGTNPASISGDALDDLPF